VYVVPRLGLEEPGMALPKFIRFKQYCCAVSPDAILGYL